MSKYIFRFRGPGIRPEADVQRIRLLKDVRLIEDSPPRMVLVDGPDETLQGLANDLPLWSISPEICYPLPDPRPRVEAPAPESKPVEKSARPVEPAPEKAGRGAGGGRRRRPGGR